MIEKKIEDIRSNYVKANYSFSDFIRRFREDLGMFQYKAAEYMGIKSQRLARLESGQFLEKPTEDEINKIATFYGISQTLLTDKAKEHENECRPLRRRRKSA